MLVKLDQLHPNQRLCIAAADGDAEVICWTGPYRSGKGIGTAVALIRLALRNLRLNRGNHQYYVAAQSAGSFVRNNGAYIQDICEQAGLSVKLVAGGLYPHYLIGDVIKLFLFGGGTARSAMMARGPTIHSAWIDEATLCQPDFIRTVHSRFSFDGGTLFLTQNADSPSNYIKVEYIDAPKPRWCIINGTFYDNPHYPDSQRRRVLDDPNKGSFYQRMVDNLWVGVEGLIYPIGQEHIVDDAVPLVGYAAIDAGTAGTTAGLLFAKTDYGYLIADEYYHKRDNDGMLSEQEHLRRMQVKWRIRQWRIDRAAAPMRADAVYGGLAATPSEGRRVIEGVQLVNNALAMGKLRIHRRCANLIREAGGLIWNLSMTGPKLGLDDHAADAMRYGVEWLMPEVQSLWLGGR